MQEFFALVLHPRLRKLLAVRWSGQLTDGIFQSALASFVLFSPERQASAMAAALGFAVVLTPYSIIGPLVGTILDRIARQRAVFISNILRSVDLIIIAILIFSGNTGFLLTLLILFAFGVNRLLLAGLSAGLPLMIERPNLIKANALAVTGGSLSVVIGGGIGIAIRRTIDSLDNANHSDGILLLIAVLGYLLATFLSSRLDRNELGPLPHENREPDGFAELIAAFRFIRNHHDAIRGILATSIQRGGLTALTIIGLLLERNTFNNPVDTEAGLAGVSRAIAIAGVGLVIGAFVAPLGVEKIGRHKWIRSMAILSSLTPILVGLFHSPWALYSSAFFVAAAGQSMKVTNDALIQSKITDDFRGRTFALYDMTVNVAIVTSALLAALFTPDSGIAPAVCGAITLVYLLVAVVVLRPSKFSGTSTN
jgi:MFS family permease